MLERKRALYPLTPAAFEVTDAESAECRLIGVRMAEVMFDAMSQQDGEIRFVPPRTAEAAALNLN